MDTGSVGLVPIETNLLPPALAKAERDVAILKRQARFAICLDDEGGYKILEPDVWEAKPVIPLIVVIGQACTRGVTHEAVLLEIGYRRTRPYRRVHAERNQVILYDRPPFHQLNDLQQRLVYPKILECLEVVLKETQLSWKSNEPWRLPSGHIVEKGVQITVDRRDRWLHRALLREDSRYYETYLFPGYVKWINRRLKYCRYNYYTPTYPRSVIAVVESMFRSSYIANPRRFERLMQMLSKRLLVESAFVHLKNFRPHFDPEAAFAFDQAVPQLPIRQSIFFYQTADQPKKKKGGHAVNCARFEVVYDRRHKPQYTRQKDDDPPF